MPSSTYKSRHFGVIIQIFCRLSAITAAVSASRAAGCQLFRQPRRDVRRKIGGGGHLFFRDTLVIREKDCIFAGVIPQARRSAGTIPAAAA
jgi:hypothetical protein